MNEIILKSRYNRFAGGALKKKETKLCEQYISTVPRIVFKGPIVAKFAWYEPNRRRDPDNIIAGSKAIFDALVNMGIIPNDTQEFVKGISHRFPDPDKGNPRIEVELEAA